MASAEEEGRRLFVGGLSGDTTDASLRAHFASFFPVANAEVSITFPDLNNFHVIRISKTRVYLKIGFIGGALTEI